MRCPFCSAQDTKVIDSRLANEGEQVRRRRMCLSCGERFTTYETTELSLPRVIKTNGTRVRFDEAKLRSGIMRALEKRPVNSDSIEQAVTHVRRKAMARGDREIPSRQIGEWVMEELRELDQVAYVRFASVYWEFADVAAFREVIDRLEREPTPEMRRQQAKLFNDGDEESRR